MTRKKIWIKTLLACSVVCLGLSVIASAIPAKNVRAETTVAELFSGSGATITPNASLPEYMKDIEWNGKKYNGSELSAVKIVSSGENETVKINYNRVIDLSECTKDVDLFDFIVAPSNPIEYTTDTTTINSSQYEFRKLYVTFTDVYDPSIYVQFDFERRQDFKYIMGMRVSTNTQKSAGWVESSHALRGSPYGTQIWSSFTGSPSTKEGLYKIVSSAYDNAEKAVYGAPYEGNNGQTCVRDLDDPAHLDTRDNIWGGFTTGEVKVTIQMAEINSGAKATMYLFAINGQSLTGEKIEDTTSPSVRVDQAAFTPDPPLAEVGTAYPLFNATAYDRLDGKIDSSKIKTKVYFDYEKESQTEVPINNGSFTPDKAGVYSVEYSVTDQSGNEGIKVVEVTARTKLSDLVCDAIGYEAPESVRLGTSLPLPENVEVLGGSGAYQTQTYVIDHKTGEKIEPENGKIVLTRKGYYSITVQATDYLGRKTYLKYTIKAEGDKVPLVQEPSMPKVIVAGRTLTLPDFEALDYTSFDGFSVEAKKQYIVSTDNFATQAVYEVGAELTPKEGTLFYKVKATSVADTSGFYESEVKTVSVIEAKSIGGYFHDASGNIRLDYTDKEHPAYKTKVDSEMTFANKLGVRNFEVNFEIAEDADSFGALSLIFADTERSDGEVVITIEKKNETACNVYVNRKSMLELNAAFAAGSEFTVSCSNGTILVNAVKVCTFADVESDSLFQNGYAYLSVSFEQTRGDSGIKLFSLNNQTYLGLFDENEDFDVTAPAVMPEREIRSVYRVGETVYIPSAIATDVLDSKTNIVVTLRKGNELLFTAGSDFTGYSFTAKEPAEYVLTYTATDSHGNSSTISYPFRVYGVIRPTLTVNGELVNAAKVGREVRLPSATAKDYKGDELEVVTYVIAPDGYMKEVVGSFTAEEAGVYIIRYTCIDGDYNYAVREYKVVVGG